MGAMVTAFSVLASVAAQVSQYPELLLAKTGPVALASQ
jgi:hypothetical protein